VGDVEVDLRIQLAFISPDLIMYRCAMVSTHLVSDLGPLGSLDILGQEDKSDRKDQEERNNSSMEGSHGDCSNVFSRN
jgi:hypothetical protein